MTGGLTANVRDSLRATQQLDDGDRYMLPVEKKTTRLQRHTAFIGSTSLSSSPKMKYLHEFTPHAPVSKAGVGLSGFPRDMTPVVSIDGFLDIYARAPNFKFKNRAVPGSSETRRPTHRPPVTFFHRASEGLKLPLSWVAQPSSLLSGWLSRKTGREPVCSRAGKCG